MARIILSVALMLVAVSLAAHHSLTGTYDMGRQTTIEGVVREFRFVNPHPFVIVEVAAAPDGAQSWQLELDNRHELAGIGITGETFKAGDRVVVTGNPGRSENHILYVTRLDRPADGFRYEQIGTTPRVARIPR